MKLNIKDYKIKKTKNYIRNTHLFFFVNGINRNSLDWLITEQGLKTIEFTYYRILNRTTVKTLNTSVYANISSTVTGSTFVIKPLPVNSFAKETVLNTFNSLFFELLVIKFNTRVYSANCLKSTYSLKYKETKLLLYQFNLTHVKMCYKLSK